jgi:DNA-binding transcriptional MerR regulator
MIAAILKVSVVTVSQWIEKELLTGSRLPATGIRRGRYRVKRKDFIRFLKEQLIPLKRLGKEKVFTTQDIAVAADVSIKTTTLWLEQGRIPFFRIVSKRRLSFEKDVRKFFERSDFDMDILEEISEGKVIGLPKKSGH